MKTLKLTVIIGLVLFALNVYAAGDLVVNGNIGAGGVTSPAYNLTVQGDISNGLYILNTNGDVVAFFNTNTAKQGRFGLYDANGNQLVRFVAGGAGTFEATTVYFKDNNGADTLVIDGDNSSVVYKGATGLSQTITVGDGSGGSCTITFTAGGVTATTCPQP
jgi:hypothetical protein